jgi:hypothetical protein
LPKSFTKLSHGRGINAVAGLGTIGFPGNQAGILQGFQMLRNRCLGQGHDIDNLTTNACAAAREGM